MGVFAPPPAPKSPSARVPSSRDGRLAAILPLLAAGVREWCRGRYWIWRAPLVLYFGWLLARRLGDPFAGSVFTGITLGVHELGHLLTLWAGPWISIPAGSFVQVAAPVAAGVVLARQRDWFGITVVAAWLGSALFELAAYMGDARARELPLAGLFPDPVHDWNWILSRLGLLSWDHALAAATRAASFVIGAAAAAAGAWICVEMARGGRSV